MNKKFIWVGLIVIVVGAVVSFQLIFNNEDDLTGLVAGNGNSVSGTLTHNQDGSFSITDPNGNTKKLTVSGSNEIVRMIRVALEVIPIGGTAPITITRPIISSDSDVVLDNSSSVTIGN